MLASKVTLDQQWFFSPHEQGSKERVKESPRVIQYLKSTGTLTLTLTLEGKKNKGKRVASELKQLFFF